jgi:hypothetical protein
MYVLPDSSDAWQLNNLVVRQLCTEGIPGAPSFQFYATLSNTVNSCVSIPVSCVENQRLLCDGS